ncbi:MAG: response regulator [Deltaproteobacteria bacterium]|nr:MAG: response regulator [Deltaproteobacteria bacterium]
MAEDEDLVRSLAERALRRQGFQVRTASNGEEALQILQADPEGVDLLLTDLVMPGMSGRQLARQAIDIRPGLPVLYMTGYSSEVVDRHGVITEGLPLILKPFTPAALVDRVRQALQGSDGDGAAEGD